MTDITTLRDALQELVDRDCRVFDRTLEIAFESNDRATGPSRRAGAQAVSQPDFAALRAARNARAKARLSKFAAENDIEESSLQSTFNPDACYCACSTGGPCEHTWDGPGYESPDDRVWSATCSRCGCTAMSHDMRFLP